MLFLFLFSSLFVCVIYVRIFSALSLPQLSADETDEESWTAHHSTPIHLDDEQMDTACTAQQRTPLQPESKRLGKDRKNFCLFCDKLVFKLPRHLEKIHYKSDRVKLALFETKKQSIWLHQKRWQL